MGYSTDAAGHIELRRRKYESCKRFAHEWAAALKIAAPREVTDAIIGGVDKHLEQS